MAMELAASDVLNWHATTTPACEHRTRAQIQATQFYTRKRAPRTDRLSSWPLTEWRSTKLLATCMPPLRPSRSGVNFITIATTNLRDSLILGGVLVIVVLFLFLFDLRTAAISCMAIPLSLLAATLVLEHLGVTLNTM